MYLLVTNYSFLPDELCRYAGFDGDVYYEGRSRPSEEMIAGFLSKAHDRGLPRILMIVDDEAAEPPNDLAPLGVDVGYLIADVSKYSVILNVFASKCQRSLNGHLLLDDWATSTELLARYEALDDPDKEHFEPGEEPRPYRVFGRLL